MDTQVEEEMKNDSKYLITWLIYESARKALNKHLRPPDLRS